MKSHIKEIFPDSQIKLIESSGGVFEVTKEGKLIFSKKSTGRFPTHEEIFEKIK